MHMAGFLFVFAGENSGILVTNQVKNRNFDFKRIANFNINRNLFILWVFLMESLEPFGGGLNLKKFTYNVCCYHCSKFVF